MVAFVNLYIKENGGGGRMQQPGWSLAPVNKCTSCHCSSTLCTGVGDWADRI